MNWKSSQLERLRNEIDSFSRDRDWDQFHSPKNLVSALLVEAAELLEIFQWSTESESDGISEHERSKVSEELADVLIYSLRLASRLGIDPIEIVERKLAVNKEKYPVDKFRGSSRKYNSEIE